MEDQREDWEKWTKEDLRKAVEELQASVNKRKRQKAIDEILKDINEEAE